MIKKVSSILRGFIDQELNKLNEYSLSHGPTIGKMYEGLTSEVLNRSIPESLGLEIKSGFIHDDAGNMTGEIDCMLVIGKGEKIPHTNSYKWHVKDVIAVFEVKKELYSSDLRDAFQHLRKVLENYSQYVASGKGHELYDIKSARRSFAEITGIIAPEHKAVSKLPIEYETIYHILVMEFLSPVRIILGYHGFKSEFALRKALIDFLGSNLGHRGFGVGSFPQLIICDRHSLVKLNGQPYTAPMRGDYWNFYTSSRTNPVRLILEFIWTRLSRRYNIGGLWGEDLDFENFIFFLSGKIKKTGDEIGWDYKYTQIKDETLRAEQASIPWEPCYLTDTQFVILNRLCEGKTERIDNTDLIQYLIDNGEDIKEFVESLQRTRLVALDGKELKLTTEKYQCVVLPNGKIAAAENNTGRLTRWISKFIDKRKP
jgi:hypothetical protein